MSGPPEMNLLESWRRTDQNLLTYNDLRTDISQNIRNQHNRVQDISVIYKPK